MAMSDIANTSTQPEGMSSIGTEAFGEKTPLLSRSDSRKGVLKKKGKICNYSNMADNVS